MFLINKIIYTLRKKSSIALSTAKFRLKLYYFKCVIGSNPIIDGMVFLKFSRASSLFIGNNFQLNSRLSSNLVGVSNYASFQCINSGKIIVGDNCGFTSTVLSARTEINIGNNVFIGGNVRVYDHDYHSLNYLNRREAKLDGADVKTETIIIENDVFIGTNSIILKGVHIGARSVIGAGSVVSLKLIPPDSIVVGNPAKIIKNLKRDKI